MISAISSADRQLNTLKDFRQAVYDVLGKARDALFDLMDANLCMHPIRSLAELSLSPVFRRAWHSTYEAVQDGEVPGKELMRLCCAQIPSGVAPVLAGDHTAWPRPQARTLAERTFEHQPTSVPGGRPITIGHGYSTLTWVPDQEGSWALPLLHERIGSSENPIAKAAEQLREVCAALPKEQPPVALYDAEYGCAPFVLATADIPAVKVMRLRPNMCLWGPPPPPSGKRGRPREHGDKFKLSDAATWPEAADTLELVDEELGPVRLQLWRGLHLRKAKGETLSLIRIERVNARGTRREPRVLWVAWDGGEEAPSLARDWRHYLRRFAVDHWYRFAKQRLHWTRPQLATPERGQTWSNLMVPMSWQLFLARGVLEDKPLPWQAAVKKMTPGRACQAWGSLLARIGTPAKAPGSATLNRGYPIAPVPGATACSRGRRRRFGGTQGGSGTLKCSSSDRLQRWSVNPAAIAGVRSCHLWPAPSGASKRSDS